MARRVRIPVRVGPAGVSGWSPYSDVRAGAQVAPPVRSRGVVAPKEPDLTPVRPEPGLAVVRPEPESHPAARGMREPEEQEQATETLEVWRDRALRLQAEAENFRKRQQRLAEERIAADRERLLRSFLGVADDLERALSADRTDAESLRQGVGLTHQNLMQLLDREGAEPIQARGEPFDPAWHEAVGTVPYQSVGAEVDTVVQVVQPGYRMGDCLLRPARVIVAT
jgi:molecular chaperone GrpE